jgi:hypothetical protein
MFSDEWARFDSIERSLCPHNENIKARLSIDREEDSGASRTIIKIANHRAFKGETSPK